MSSIEKRLRDELGELASWLIDRRAESSSVEQADSGSDSIPRDSGADSIPRLDLDADTVRSGGRGRLVRIAAVLVLIVGLVGASGLLSEDAPSVVTVPADPATQTPTTRVPTTSVSPTTTVDDLSTDDAGDESSIVDLAPEVEFAPEADLAPEVELDVPPSEAFDETSTGAEEWRSIPWLVPWGDGFLRIGYLNTSEEGPTERNLFAQTSDDGLNWGQPFQLNLPREHFGAFETDIELQAITSPSMIRSNGEHLVILSQWPSDYLISERTSPGHDLRSAPVSVHIEQRVFISVTDDLDSWNLYEYSLPPPDGIHGSLGNNVVVQDLIVSNEGWMMQVSTLTYMDIGLLVPTEIQESAKEIRWIRYEDGEYVDTDGLLVEWSTEDANSELVETHRRYFTWEELGITRDIYSDYGSIANKPYHPEWRYSSSVLVGRWGEEAIRAELPERGICCDIVATDGGYFGILNPRHPGHEPGYAPGIYGWGSMIFSPDGLTWQRIDAPVDGLFQSSEDCNMVWVPSIHAVEGGLVMSGPESWKRPCGCSSERFQSELVFVGDDRGLNWEPQNISDNPCHESYNIVRSERNVRSAGKGVLMDIYVPLDYSEKPETWSDRYHSTVVSIDGKNWFTFYEESDPGWWSSVAFNGNVAVRVDAAGNSFRYELQ